MKKIMLSLCCIAVMLVTNVVIASETTPAGLWKTIDDKTGKPRSLIRITENNGEYSAVVEKGLLATDTGEAVCDKCTDSEMFNLVVTKGISSPK